MLTATLLQLTLNKYVLTVYIIKVTSNKPAHALHKWLLTQTKFHGAGHKMGLT